MKIPNPTIINFITSKLIYSLGVLFVSGLALALSFAPLSILIIAYISICILIYFLTTIENHPHKHKIGFFYGLSFGLGWFGGGVSWVYITLQHFGGMSVFLAAFVTLAFCFILAVYPALTALSITYLTKYKRFIININPSLIIVIWSITFSSIFTIVEVIRSHLFSGFGWLSFGYAHTTISPISLKAYAPIVGERGITWLTIFICALITLSINRYWQTKRLKIFITPLIIILTIFILGNVSTILYTTPTNKALDFLVVQGNLNINTKWDENKYQENLDSYLRLINNALPANLISPQTVVVLPETALSVFTTQKSLNFIDKLIAKNVNIIVGGIEVASNNSGDEYFNSALIIDDIKSQFYRKRHLVPFGEYPPIFFEWLAKTFNIPMANLSSGSYGQINPIIQNINLAFSICYENLFPEEYRQQIKNSQILINISNTGWYGHSWASPQHLQISQMRVLEAQKPMIHSADTGISAFINVNGEVENKIPAHTQGSFRAKVYGVSGNTPFINFGEKLIWAGIIIFQIVVFLIIFFNRKKNVKQNKS